MYEYLQFPVKQFLEKFLTTKDDKKGTSPFVTKKERPRLSMKKAADENLPLFHKIFKLCYGSIQPST